MPKTIKNLKSDRLYSDQPIQSSPKQTEKIKKFFTESFFSAKEWFRTNYEEDFLKYLANFQSIPGDIIKPWPDANDYFMPATMINVENYLARIMETIRGAREFVTVMPRGQNDMDRATIVEQYLRYTFEQPMNGYSQLVNGIRNTLIYGTSVYTMPWEMKIHRRRIRGKYLFDTETNDWVREIPEERQFQMDPTPPKDFSGIDLTPVTRVYDNFEERPLFENIILKDSPKLELQDVFNVKVDPHGGTDIQNHAYVIVESVETKDEIKRKVAQGIYDSEQVKRLFQRIDALDLEFKETDESKDARDALEQVITDFGKKDGVKMWTCYGKQALEEDGMEDEVIGVLAGSGQFVLRLVNTPFAVNGVPYKPILVDRFIELPHRFYGIGIGNILSNLNYLLNHLVNQVLNHGDLYNSPPLIAPEDSIFDLNDLIWGPGQVFRSDTSDSYKILETPDIKQGQILMIQFLEGFIQKSLGINDFTTAGGGIVNNQTAHGLANIMRETNRRIDFYSKNQQETFIRKMFEMILWESQEFLDKAEIPKIVDINTEGERTFDVQTVLGKDLKGSYDIRIFTDSLTASREFQQLKWTQLIQLFGQVVDPFTGQPIYDIKKIGDQVLKAFDEPYPQTYYLNPQNNPLSQLGVPAMPQPREADSRRPATPNLEAEAEGRLGPI